MKGLGSGRRGHDGRCGESGGVDVLSQPLSGGRSNQVATTRCAGCGSSVERPTGRCAGHRPSQQTTDGTKSGTDPKGLGLRDDMFDRAIKFKKVLEKAPGAGPGPINYVFMGDPQHDGHDLHLPQRPQHRRRRRGRQAHHLRQQTRHGATRQRPAAHLVDSPAGRGRQFGALAGPEQHMAVVDDEADWQHDG